MGLTLLSVTRLKSLGCYWATAHVRSPKYTLFSWLTKQVAVVLTLWCQRGPLFRQGLRNAPGARMGIKYRSNTLARNSLLLAKWPGLSAAFTWPNRQQDSTRQAFNAFPLRDNRQQNPKKKAKVLSRNSHRQSTSHELLLFKVRTRTCSCCLIGSFVSQSHMKPKWRNNPSITPCASLQRSFSLSVSLMIWQPTWCIDKICGADYLASLPRSPGRATWRKRD